VPGDIICMTDDVGSTLASPPPLLKEWWIIGGLMGNYSKTSPTLKFPRNFGEWRKFPANLLQPDGNSLHPEYHFQFLHFPPIPPPFRVHGICYLFQHGVINSQSFSP
jgi:hypothetical protein